MGQEYIREGKRFLYEESGIGVVEIILILVVLVGLILIFKKQLTSLVNKTFTNINNKAGIFDETEILQRKCQYFLCTDTCGTYIRAVCVSGGSTRKCLKNECTSAYRTGGRCGVCVLSTGVVGTVSFAVLGGVRRRKRPHISGKSAIYRKMR